MRNLFVTFIFKIILFLNLWSSTSYSLINLQENSIVMTMMIRDEAVNIRSNLPLWKKFINYFIFMIDERTVDDTEDAIREILGKDCPYQLISYKFEGFGPARTLSLQNAWKYYPQATHVWIADPDWRPELDTMDKRDLDLIHDAFRFLIYDRNGLTTRRCDWLLRHRKGLAMRYHLHEVLDIGETYSPSPIKWVVREIEQKGSWHTTVGHGHSMSAARYKFDLELLEKDKLAYGHNPHTHHYLGITHEAYAEGLFKANGGKMTSEIQFHFDEAVKYFTKRITEVYEPEFMEERWACMFSLGALYFQYLNDPIRALRWFKACHDFSPQQTECAISMLSVYESLGVLNKVVETLQIILRTEHEERGMLNHFKHWICDVPTTAVRVMNYMDKIYKNLTVVDAKYMVLVAGIAQSKKCQEYGSTLSNDLVVAVREVARVNGIPSSFLSQYQLLCKDSDLQNYLLENKYQLHPCENVFHEYQRGKMCSDFDKELAAPVESLQIDVHGEFIGAASLFDIIHHCYEGRVGPLYRNPRGTFKILFAEYFNLRNIYSLLVFAKKYKLESKLEIIVLTSNQQMEAEIRGTAQFCLSTVSSLLSSIKFITWDATGRISQALKASNYGYFDYIEYNGGISLDPNYLEHLADLKMMIGKSGVLGVTAFVQNLYQERISSTLRSHYNPDAHIPFSTDTTKLIKEMLITFGLERYTKDNQLLITLANPNTRYFSKNDIVDIIDSLQLRVVSWFPTALMNPYDLLPHEPIQRYKSYGMSEIDFIHTIVSPFRASLYITQSEVLGSANITDLRHFDIGSIVVDRINGVANNFPGAETLAKSSLSLTVNFPFTSQQFPRQAISMTIHPNILGSFGLLSSKPTLQNMLIQNQKTGGASFPIETLKTSLVQSLEFFVLWNYITLWIESDDSPPVATTNQGTVNRVKDQTTTEKLNIRQEHGKSGNSEVLPSGLTFRKAETKKEVKVNEEKSSMKEKINTKDDDIPPICRVPGISGGSFCETYQSKKSQSQSTSQAPKSSNTKEQKQEKVEDNRIENLKKMGFTENIIKKILAKNEEKSASSNKLETPPKDKDRPAICSLPGVNAESLCRAYEGNARKEKSRAPIERKLPFPEYRPQSRSQLLATFRNPDCMK